VYKKAFRGYYNELLLPVWLDVKHCDIVFWLAAIPAPNEYCQCTEGGFQNAGASISMIVLETISWYKNCSVS